MIPYPSYKSTDLPWLPKIPEHWTVNKVRHFYHSILGKMLASSQTDSTYTYEKYLCAKDVHFSGVDLSDLKEMWFSPEEKKKYQIKAGDLLVVEGGAGAGGAAIFKGFGESLYIQNSIHRVRPKTDNVTVQFLYYWLCAFVRRKYVDYACNKATIPHFTGDKLSEMPFVLAPLAEQEQIVRYLDAMTAKINKLIRAKKKQIALLQEQRQAIINRAVTRGLDPNAEMKDSGIDWLGEIPKHWNVCKVKHLCSMQAGDNLTADVIQETGEYPVYGANGRRGFYHAYNLNNNCLLVGRQGALCGNVHIVFGKIWATDHAVVTVPTKRTHVSYLYYLLLAMNLNQYALETAAQPGLSVSVIQNLPTLLVPLDEQKAIAACLDKQCAIFDTCIDKMKKTIDALTEYQNSLISYVVTGQIDVRDINIEPFDSSELSAETEEETINEDQSEQEMEE